MNQVLHDYVRSANFNMSLSERQIEVLLILDKHGYGAWLASKCGPQASSAGVVQLLKLCQKGLIAQHNHSPVTKAWHVTKAGQLMAELLAEAGYKLPAIFDNYKGSEAHGTSERTDA